MRSSARKPRRVNSSSGAALVLCRSSDKGDQTGQDLDAHLIDKPGRVGDIGLEEERLRVFCRERLAGAGGLRVSDLRGWS